MITSTEIEKFKEMHIIHDYMLFDENGDKITKISSTKKELNNIVFNVIKRYNRIRVKYYNSPAIKKVTARQLYTGNEYIFYI